MHVKIVLDEPAFYLSCLKWLDIGLERVTGVVPNGELIKLIDSRPAAIPATGYMFLNVNDDLYRSIETVVYTVADDVVICTPTLLVYVDQFKTRLWRLCKLLNIDNAQLIEETLTTINEIDMYLARYNYRRDVSEESVHAWSESILLVGSYLRYGALVDHLLCYAEKVTRRGWNSYTDEMLSLPG